MKACWHEDGSPGYVDVLDGKSIGVTVFREGADALQKVKPGDRVWVAPAGVDRKPTSGRTEAVVEERKQVGQTVVLRLHPREEVQGFREKGLFRLWVEKPE